MKKEEKLSAELREKVAEVRLDNEGNRKTRRSHAKRSQRRSKR